MSVSTRGVHWGTLSAESDSLVFKSHGTGARIFSLGYASISNSTITKSDIVIQAASEEVGAEDCICQVRFYIEEDNKTDMAQEGEEPEKFVHAKKVYQQIVERARIGEFAGESVATLNQVNLAVPRGKYTVDFYQKNLRFHGVTFSYNVDYRNIMKGFILPMINEAQVSIVLQLNKDKPIYQGQTVYRYIILNIKKDLEVQIKTKVSPQNLERFPALKEVQAEYKGEMFQIFVDLLQHISGITMIHPGANFKSKAGHPCVKCSIKAQPGWLYFLKQSVLFINKPVLYVRIEDIKKVDLSRLTTTTKQFDMRVSIKNEKQSIQFLGIERVQFEAISEYFKTRSVQLNVEAEASKVVQPLEAEDDEEEEDEDFEAGDGEGDSDDDASESFSESKP